KRLHEDDPCCLLEEPKAKRNLSNGFSSPAHQSADYSEYSPPNSLSTSSSNSSHSTQSEAVKNHHNENPLSSRSHHLTTIVPHNPDCVVHNNDSLPQELTRNDNPSYYEQNLLLYYAHLERVRRHGTNIHSSQ
ncbi:unnamed protein product, partial [Didymodactylos carnosus]